MKRSTRKDILSTLCLLGLTSCAAVIVVWIIGVSAGGPTSTWAVMTVGTWHVDYNDSHLCLMQTETRHAYDAGMNPNSLPATVYYEVEKFRMGCLSLAVISAAIGIASYTMRRQHGFKSASAAGFPIRMV